ncbi:MAG: hypothetical protein K0R21_1621 [Anaerocolumna sp.]|nr:hypothetical protein [Anaerocolumna sp.]
MLLSIGFIYLRESKYISFASASNLSEFAVELTESDITMYDGLEVTGSDVVNFIKKNLGSYTSTQTSPVYVYVETEHASNTYYNEAEIDNIQNFTHEKYIKPISKFIGEIVRDGNDVIVGLRFCCI